MRKIEKVIKLRNMHDPELEREDLDYWLSRPPDERVAQVDILRWEFHGGPQRLQGPVRHIQRSRR